MLKTNNNQSISIVLPNYNGKKLLEKNLPSLIKAAERFEYEIIVVDDHSTDDSAPFLEESYPQVTTITSKENHGFSVTCNKGINAAKMQFICIVNTDVTFSENYFINALENFTSPEIFAVKGDIINYRDSFDNIIVIERVFQLHFKRGFLRFNPNVLPERIHNSTQLNTQFVLLGCCFICRGSMLKELNGYDEIYSPFYWEDSDIAIRALKKGYTLIYDERCIIYHELSATISNHVSNTKRRLVSNRNKFIFTWRHLAGIKNWITHIFYTILNFLTRWIILDWKYYVAFMLALHRTILYKSINSKPISKKNETQ